MVYSHILSEMNSPSKYNLSFLLIYCSRVHYLSRVSSTCDIPSPPLSPLLLTSQILHEAPVNADTHSLTATGERLFMLILPQCYYLVSRLSSLSALSSLSTQNWSSYFILSFTLFYVISQAISLSETHCNVISDCKCDCTMLHPSTCPLIHFSSLSLSHSLPLCPCAAASLLIHVSCDASIW